jgi:hypothetical protein
MTPTEKAIRDFCGHHADWWPSTTQVQEMLALAKLEQEPVEPLEYWNAVEGWVKIDEVREHFDSVGCGTIYKTAGEDRVPVSTAPFQREIGFDRAINDAVEAEREACCAIVYGQCESDNVAQRTVDAIRARGTT